MGAHPSANSLIHFWLSFSTHADRAAAPRRRQSSYLRAQRSSACRAAPWVTGSRSFAAAHPVMRRRPTRPRRPADNS